MVYDYVVLGGGVIGCAILNKFTRLNKKCLLIEKGSDVAVGTSKANSGIVHAGFDAKPNTLKARLNVRGAELYPQLCEELKVPYVRNGALVIGNNEEVLKDLYERGQKNNVKGLSILNRNEIIKKLPNITENITCGLFASTSAIVSPYQLTIALAEQSVINGSDVVFNFDLKDFSRENDYYVLSDGNQKYYARKIIVAVGCEHNKVAKILGTTQYDLKFRRGEYYLLDKGAMDINGFTIFPLPSKSSKGVLISVTTSGNIIVGPTSIPSDEKTVTTSEGLKEISVKANEILTNVNLKKNIRVFSGVRTLVGDDFVIEKDKNNNDIINVTGICSPGLTSAPAIAEYIVSILEINNTEKEMKPLNETEKLVGKTNIQINELIKKDERFGKIICRCEKISEMEIINAINSPLKPISLDGIKRRTRAGMGRCQGGFCFLKVMELVAKERGITIDEVIKENKNSRIIIGDIE